MSVTTQSVSVTTQSAQGLSAAQKKELWERWKAGESLTEIGRALEKRTGSVHWALKATGGFAPPHRHRSKWALSLSEREEISRGVAAGDSFRAIAARLGRSASSVSREVNRNGGRLNYRATKGEERAWEKARRPKRCLLANNARLRDVVAKKLKEDFSPEQVSGWLKRHYPNDEAMRVSAETIYRTLFVQARGALKKELLVHLRSGRTMRYPRKRSSASTGRPGQIKDAISIRERPPEAEDRAVPGHWEGDLLAGSRNTYIATLVERSSRFVRLVRLTDKQTTSVVEALSDRITELPRAMMESLTWDRGTEMADHKKFTVATDVMVYFCDPRSPWQRGTNENTNRLLRQYLPKGSDLSVHTQHELDLIAMKLNTRPRKTLGYRTPADTLAQTVALTG
jgi:IS30 family transposase